MSVACSMLNGAPRKLQQRSKRKTKYNRNEMKMCKNEMIARTALENDCQEKIRAFASLAATVVTVKYAFVYYSFASSLLCFFMDVFICLHFG